MVSSKRAGHCARDHLRPDAADMRRAYWIDRQSAGEVLTLLQLLNRDYGKTVVMVHMT